MMNFISSSSIDPVSFTSNNSKYNRAEEIMSPSIANPTCFLECTGDGAAETDIGLNAIKLVKNSDTLTLPNSM